MVGVAVAFEVDAVPNITAWWVLFWSALALNSNSRFFCKISHIISQTALYRIFRSKGVTTRTAVNSHLLCHGWCVSCPKPTATHRCESLPPSVVTPLTGHISAWQISTSSFLNCFNHSHDGMWLFSNKNSCSTPHLTLASIGYWNNRANSPAPDPQVLTLRYPIHPKSDVVLSRLNHQTLLYSVNL